MQPCLSQLGVRGQTEPLPQYSVGDTQENMTGSGAILVCLTREVVSGAEEVRYTALRRQRAFSTASAWLPDFFHGPPRLPDSPPSLQPGLHPYSLDYNLGSIPTA